MFVYFIFCSQNQNYLTSLLKKSRPGLLNFARNKVVGSYFVRPGRAGLVGEWAQASRTYKLYRNNGPGRA